jgi:hypothetical protein
MLSCQCSVTRDFWLVESLTLCQDTNEITSNIFLICCWQNFLVLTFALVQCCLWALYPGPTYGEICPWYFACRFRNRFLPVLTISQQIVPWNRFCCATPVPPMTAVGFLWNIKKGGRPLLTKNNPKGCGKESLAKARDCQLPLLSNHLGPMTSELIKRVGPVADLYWVENTSLSGKPLACCQWVGGVWGGKTGKTGTTVIATCLA